jgi:RNA polymerase sigma factor (sigma-70 family)
MEISTPALEPHARADATASQSIETLYREHRSLLLYLSCRRFGVPENDAESLIQEVFVSYLLRSSEIAKVRAWLVAAICNASRYYLRTRGRMEPLPDDYSTKSDPSSDSLDDRFALEMTIQKVLGYLQPKCRDTLRMHYFEGRSASEIAIVLETTTRYAEKMIHKCLQRAREIYATIAQVRP